MEMRLARDDVSVMEDQRGFGVQDALSNAI